MYIYIQMDHQSLVEEASSFPSVRARAVGVAVTAAHKAPSML